MTANENTKWSKSTLVLGLVVFVCMAGIICGVIYLATSRPSTFSPKPIVATEDAVDVRTIAPPLVTSEVPHEASSLPATESMHTSVEPSPAIEIWEATAIWPQSAEVILIRRRDHERLVRVQLAGIRAPAKATRDTQGQEPWGTRAHQYVVVRVSQQRIRFEIDPVATAANNARPIGYLWLGDAMLNEELLAGGYVFYQPDHSIFTYASRLRNAQVQARTEQLGIWNSVNPLVEALAGPFSETEANTAHISR